jgi:FADH2 O2-dependent halogenase
MRVAPAACDVAVVGSGFAGSILARVLARIGLSVVLVERGRHPRFALGESTTPLANLVLERLARRYDLPDLHALAAYGRWLRALPDLRRGLKRGFTFYRHVPGAAYANGPDNEARLLVAASPDDGVADSHWLRADVDHHLARAAAAEERVELWEDTELAGVELGAGGARLRGRRGGHSIALQARLLIDASGPGGFLARHLPIAPAPVATDSRLVFGHFAGVRLFADVAVEQGAAMPPGPYPDDLAALHHVFPGGWMYVLRFDHGVTSAGFLLRHDPPAAELTAWAPADPQATFRALLGRYPAIAAQFREAAPVLPPGQTPRVQHRLARAAGDGWALLPHTYAFFDPLFSTGIAWSLLGVERLARLLEDGVEAAQAGLDRYERALAAEADRLDLLTHAAYQAMPDFDLFRWVAMLYFAAVSFAEVRQRLVPEEETGRAAAWDGFLGTGDPVLDPVFAEAARRVAAHEPLAPWLVQALAPRNVAGLADPSRRHLYPVDLDLLRERAPLLGLSRAELSARLHLLRSPAAAGT